MSHVTSTPVGQGPEMIQEHWLRYFCEKEEAKALVQWLHEEGLNRPRGIDERVAHAEKLRKMGNDWYNKDDFRRALHCGMGAVHSIDFTPAEQMSHSEEQRTRVSQVMLPVMSNLTMTFLKRGDFVNAETAASCGLRCAKKLPDEETIPMRAKLLYRRGLAKGEGGPAKDLAGARADLTEAAKLEPNNREIRTCLETAKALAKKEEKESPLRFGVPAKKEPDRPGLDADTDGKEGKEKVRKELSPLAEKFAQVVGTCLGRTLRRYKKVKQGSKDGLLMPLVVLAIIAPMVGFAIHLTSGLPYPPSGPTPS